jgi:putative toxin-antitoxin system antitoxin component (TIGR02293 family)
MPIQIQAVTKPTRKKVNSKPSQILSWTSESDLIALSRAGVSYEAIEELSRILKKPVKDILQLLGVPQTTYNKNKNAAAHLNLRTAEFILLLFKLVNFGKDVFNDEEDKFLRWLEKPSIALGGQSPFSLLDTYSGLKQVENELYNIEYGIFV